MRPLEGHTKDVRTVAYLPDGRALSGSSDKTVRLWLPAGGSCLTTIKAKGPVYAVRIGSRWPVVRLFWPALWRERNRTSSSFAIPRASRSASVNCARKRRFLQQIPGTFSFQQVSRWTARSIWSIAFSADGNYLAAACRRPGSANIPYGRRAAPACASPSGMTPFCMKIPTLSLRDRLSARCDRPQGGRVF